MKLPEFPIPKRPDNVAYWVVAAVGGALFGGLIYSWLVRNDPI